MKDNPCSVLLTFLCSKSTSGVHGGAFKGAQQGPSKSDTVIDSLPSLSELALQFPSSL